MSTVVERSPDRRAAPTGGPWGFPFRSELSLLPLIDFWTGAALRQSPTHAAMARVVEGELVRAEELRAPIADLAVIERHRDLVDALMAVVFAPASWEHEYGAAMVPFQLHRFYATPSFERLLMSPDGRLAGRMSTDAATILSVRALYGFSLVLGRVYGVPFEFEPPIVLTIADPGTGLDRHFRLQFDPRFIEVVPQRPVAPLDAATRRRIEQHLTEPGLLATLVPTQDFLLRGFTVLRAHEVTDQEVISSLKRDLIERESITSNVRFAALQDKLRTLFRRPRLHLGLAAIEGDQVLKLNASAPMEHSCIFADSAHKSAAEFSGSCYERAVQARRPLVIEDLAECQDRTRVESDVLGGGFRNLVIAPLFYQDELIGMLDLASTEPGDLNVTHLPKLEDVLPLFSVAVQRGKEELEERIQAFIKEKCTAIHPSVEWRFRQAVLSGLDRLRGGGPLTEIEPIVFSDVYPLYGLADIRGSSTQRAFAIQADLLTQLGLARDVLRAAHAVRPLPALDELAFRVERHMGLAEVSLRSGDEIALITFLRNEIEPRFDHLATFGAGVPAAVEAYRAALEPGLGTVYDRRRAFEESVNLINETISSYLDLEEQAAQAMFPHYFEKQKTDGVDYGIYVGASLVEDGAFDPLYLRSLRLWQLMITCGITARTERLKGRLALPLETTHLVLAHHLPLSIRFRFDEKRFDVDGAYNMRYQIVKKRIDKAVIREGGERLTQPGRIAIVYSQPSEAAEYRDYVDYLRHRGYVGRQVEDVELEELQGVQGLRALRVAVEVDNRDLDGQVPLAEVRTAAAG